MRTRLAIHGACGRMGRRLIALAREDASLQVAAAIDSPKHAFLGCDAGELAGVGALGVLVSAELALDAQVDCLIDFSSPAGTLAILPTCVARRIPVVVATTGHESHEKAEIAAAAHHTAVMFSPARASTSRLSNGTTATRKTRRAARRRTSRRSCRTP